jgi:hypothetical protein
MFCENCGKAIPDNAPACGYCGQLFASPAGGAAVSAPYVAASYAVPPRQPSSGPFLVMQPFRSGLGALEKGQIIRAGVALALRILGAVVLLSGIHLVIATLKMAFNLPTTATIGGIVAAALMGGATFAIFQILYYRADSIARLGDSAFTVIPIFSLLFRAWGESYATFATTLGVAGCLFTWFSGMNPAMLIGSYLPVPAPPSIPMESAFVAGLVFLIILLFAAFLVLILFYFFAEAVLVIADIARNVRVLVKASGAPEAAR